MIREKRWPCVICKGRCFEMSYGAATMNEKYESVGEGMKFINNYRLNILVSSQPSNITLLQKKTRNCSTDEIIK